MTDEPDEWTPRERGVMAGRDYAEEVGRGTLTVRDEHNEPMPPDVLLRHAAEDSPRIPAAIGQLVQEHLGERFAASEDPDAESAFWVGFVTGVRAYIVQTRSGLTPN